VSPKGSGTILLVEDNPEVATVSIGLLEQLGYNVRWAADASAALAELEKDGIDIVFSDVVMPGRWTGSDWLKPYARKTLKFPSC
jgi:CheY-like chemotaxis protein